MLISKRKKLCVAALLFIPSFSFANSQTLRLQPSQFFSSFVWLFLFSSYAKNEEKNSGEQIFSSMFQSTFLILFPREQAAPTKDSPYFTSRKRKSDSPSPFPSFTCIFLLSIPSPSLAFSQQFLQ